MPLIVDGETASLKLQESVTRMSYKAEYTLRHCGGLPSTADTSAGSSQASPSRPFTAIEVHPEAVSGQHNTQNQLCVALTVHRSQGATFDTAHLYADGGGRELGYVAMSRARQSAHMYAVADNIDEAVEDPAWEWGRERRQAWAIDTGHRPTRDVIRWRSKPINKRRSSCEPFSTGHASKPNEPLWQPQHHTSTTRPSDDRKPASTDTSNSSTSASNPGKTRSKDSHPRPD
jgi:hypothetical protein